MTIDDKITDEKIQYEDTLMQNWKSQYIFVFI